ncbi:MAG: F0F1 ATP synthase subunit delta [Rhizobiales bacterium]|nr:F0F1 ATP synthase subunit delta [Hyphomicrobiales bacterium]
MSNTQSIISGMPGRYATALFDLAKDAKQLDEVGTELNNFSQLIKDNAELTRLVESPVFTADQQSKAINAIVAASGLKGLTANFISLVAKNRRLFAINAMIKAYRGLVSLEKGEITAEVLSAAKLTKAQTDALKKALKDAVGKEVQLELSVDPSILGGLRVKVGSKLVDNSLRTKLNNLKLAMKEVG